MVEKIGSGISRIKEAMKEVKLAKPVFKTKGMFTVVFTRIALEKSVEESVEKTTREKIKELIKDNSTITTKEIADAVGITAKGVEYQLAKMQEDKILIREGSKKSGKWILI